jgi:hypothetical protein
MVDPAEIPVLTVAGMVTVVRSWTVVDGATVTAPVRVVDKVEAAVTMAGLEEM